jgi:hypothetical protein
MKVYFAAIIFAFILVCASNAEARCNTIVLPDGTVLIVCCDSHGNCTYH